MKLDQERAEIVAKYDKVRVLPAARRVCVCVCGLTRHNHNPISDIVLGEDGRCYGGFSSAGDIKMICGRNKEFSLPSALTAASRP